MLYSFNPLAPTLLKKILCDIAVQEAPSNFSTKDLVENICQSSCGDLRSAINCLQFAFLQGSYY
jgi:DNA polymerase III delta prime subunit